MSDCKSSWKKRRAVGFRSCRSGKGYTAVFVRGYAGNYKSGRWIVSDRPKSAIYKLCHERFHTLVDVRRKRTRSRLPVPAHANVLVDRRARMNICSALSNPRLLRRYRPKRSRTACRHASPAARATRKYSSPIKGFDTQHGIVTPERSGKDLRCSSPTLNGKS